MARLLITLCDISAGVPGGLWVPHTAWYLTVAKVLLGGALQTDFTPMKPVWAGGRRLRMGSSSAAAFACAVGRGQHWRGCQTGAGGQEALSVLSMLSVSSGSPWLSPQFHGPRIGALYARSPGTATPLHPMLFGGGQERSFRPG